MPLPEVAFLPGRTARPSRAGFELDGTLLAPERWRENLIWLHGVDLYNHGFAWEAHEAWEQIWAASPDPLQKRFLQSLIQAAASALKRALDERSGSRRLAQRACDGLDALSSELSPNFMGLDHARFCARFRAFGASAEARFDDRPRLRLQ
jgi:hypothetical protein